MNKYLSRSILALFLIATLIVLAACGIQNTGNQEDVGDNANENSMYGGQVVVAIPQDLDFLDPHKAAASGTQEIMFNVFEGLLKPDPNGDLKPAIAQEYSVSKDGLTYTFTLREGVKFHNGNDVTVEDVKYSYERLMGANDADPLSTSFSSGVESVDTPDEKTVVVKLNKVNASFLANFTYAILPRDNDSKQNESPIGTGPFKFVEYLPSQRVVLDKNEEYWQEGVPYLDKVEFRIIADAQATLMSFKSGEVDILPRVSNEQLDSLGTEYNFVNGEQNMVQAMFLNNDVEPFDDVKVRQAINFAINKDEIIEAVAYGNGTKLGSNMSPVMANYYEEGLENVYDTNIDKAKQLLKEAGYEKGFQTSITVPAEYTFHVDTAQIIVEQLKEVGIEVEIKQVEWSVWLDKTYNGREYEMTIIALTGKLDPHDVLGRYHSTFSSNFFNYSNINYDKIIDAALVEVDTPKRAELYKKAQRILTEDAVAVYIMDPNFVNAMDKELIGYKLYPIYVQDMSTIYYNR